jgi:transposase
MNSTSRKSITIRFSPELIRPKSSVTVLNPLQIATYRKTGIRKLKSDASDAVWIADYIRVSNLRPTTPDLPVLLQLRELTRFRFRLSEQTPKRIKILLC